MTSTERAQSLVKEFAKLELQGGGSSDGGVGAVCKGVAAAAGAQELLGGTEDVQAEVATWVAFADEFSADKLQQLNAHLETRSVVAGLGMAITVADLACFAAIHEALDVKTHDFTSLTHVLRWIDYVQIKQAVYPVVPVEKPKFNPPKPAQRAPKPAKEEAKKPAAKKEKAPAAKKESDTSFSALDVRVGVITKVWKHPGADALYVEEIDIGEAAPRQIVSGLAKFLTEEQMLKRKVLVLTNVKPGKVRDVMSSGLVLCASNGDHSQCEPVVPPAEAKVGDKVTVAGFEGAPEEVLNPKKKQFEKIQPDLATDGSGVACYRGIPFMLSDYNFRWLTRSGHGLQPGATRPTGAGPSKVLQEANEDDKFYWLQYFQSPEDWWDSRLGKPSPRMPDFKHINTRKALWIDGWRTPSWVKSRL